MFRILCDPSSGSTEFCLIEITMVCVYGTAGWELVPSRPYRRLHTHHRFKITLPNTDQAHDKIFVNHYE
jgi:hypothetical protein